MQSPEQQPISEPEPETVGVKSTPGAELQSEELGSQDTSTNLEDTKIEIPVPKKIEESERFETEKKYSSAVAYFEYLEKEGDEKLQELRAQKSIEESEKEKKDDNKIEELNYQISRRKGKYIRIASALKRGDADEAKRYIAEQIKRMEKQAKDKVKLQKNEEYSNFLELMGKFESEVVPEQEPLPSVEEVVYATEKEIQPKSSEAEATEAQKKIESNPDSNNFYERLGISENASEEDIKKAYYEQVKVYHPDKNIGDKMAEERFKKIQEAFESLTPKSEQKENFSIDTLNDLIKEKREIESRLSHEDNPEAKKLLLELKKKKSVAIIENGCHVLGLDPKSEKEKIERDKEEEWNIAILASGHKSIENYEKWHKDIYYNEIIKNSSLSNERKEELIETGNINITSWRSSIELDRNDVVALIGMGVNLNEIKRVGLFFKKIMAGKTVLADNLEELKTKITESKAKIDEDAQKKMKQRKKEIIEKGVEQTVLDKSIKEIKDAILVKQKAEEEAREKRMEEERQKKVEVAKNLPIGEKIKLINDLRKRWAKAEKIFNILKTGKRKIKTEDGRTLEVGKDNEEIEKLRDSYSTEVVRFANELSGIDLIKEIKNLVGYNPKEEPKNLEKQKDFRKLLTKKVKEIYRNSKKEIERSSGKKIKVKKKKTNKAKSLSVSNGSLVPATEEIK